MRTARARSAVRRCSRGGRTAEPNGRLSESLESRLATELAPDLEVIRSIGRGSVAQVYLARETGLKRLVAVKVLRRELASDDVARKRFEREAQAAARINHPNITDIHRIGHLSDGVPYIVMEYIDGRTLADFVKATGPMPVDAVRGLLADVAAALAGAHAQGVVHRDVRPNNIIRENATGRTVLMDFGIAGLLESGGETVTRLTAQGVRLGDLRYMSPEQMRGETVTVQADVYSLGVVGFELLAGKSPFGSSPGVQAMAAQLRGERQKLAELRPDLEPALTGLIDRCLAQNPTERPQAKEVAAALSRAAGPDAAVAGAKPTSALGIFLEELKRRRVYRVGATYLAAIFVVLQFAELIQDTIRLPYEALVVVSLGGFPVTLVLAWVFDIREGHIRRTRSLAEQEGATLSRARRALPLIALGVSVVLALAVIWWLAFR